jgi:hypothetical protein
MNTTATPREIDTRLAELYGTRAQHWTGADKALEAIHRKLGDPKGRHGYRMSHQQARTDAAQALDAGTLRPFDRDVVTKALAALAEHEAQVAALTAEIAPLDAEYDRRRWTRYVVVVANGGHIHSGTRCLGGSIRPTTQVQWQPALSGKPVAEAVAQLGPTLCSLCFKNAPVKWTQGTPETQAKADGTCTGSGKGYEPGTWKRNGPNGYGTATCTGCNTTRATTPAHRVKKHQASA